MPIWGLSALAVGSIGAPLPSTGKKDIRPNRNVSMSSSVDSPIVQPPQNPLNAGHTHSGAKDYMVSLQSHAIASQRSALSVGRRTDMESDDATNPVISASALPLKTISETGMSQPGQAEKYDAMIPPAVNALAGSIIPTMQPANNRSIYGTLANNAYKVYFPQIEPPALGNVDEDIQSFNGAPDQDDRVLKKNGSYLFYEAPADTEVAKKIEADLKSDRNLDAETLARAVAKLGKGPEEEKLTAPPLQKKPLVFGESLFQTSVPSEGDSETPAAEHDVEPIKTPKD